VTSRLRHRLFFVALATLPAACGGDAPVPTAPAGPAVAVVEPSVRTAEAPKATASARRGPAAPPPAELPRFVRLDVDPRKESTLRGRLNDAGPAMLTDRAVERGAPGPAAKPPRAGAQQVIVLGETRDSLHVLCESNVRVGVYIPRWSFDDVALSGAVMVPSRPEHFDERTPGVHFIEGAPVEVLGMSRDREMLRARYEDDRLKAEGLVAKERVGKAFRPPPPPSVGGSSELPHGGRLLNAPGGSLVATIKAPRSPNEAPLVAVLKAEGKQSLVSFRTRDYTAVGWVPTATVRTIDGGIGRVSVGVGTGWGVGTKNPLTLDPAVVLRDPESRAPVGVVVSKTTLGCVSECDGRSPRVVAPACKREVEVVADLDGPKAPTPPEGR
jgi:hypothetical protein